VEAFCKGQSEALVSIRRDQEIRLLRRTLIRVGKTDRNGDTHLFKAVPKGVSSIPVATDRSAWNRPQDQPGRRCGCQSQLPPVRLTALRARSPARKAGWHLAAIAHYSEPFLLRVGMRVSLGCQRLKSRVGA